MAHLNRKIGIPSFDLTGKTAIVTGGTQGLGFGIACALAAYGANVVITARTASKVEDAVADLNENYCKGGRAYGIPADSSKKENVKMVIDKTVEEFGELNILINNAGTGAVAPAEEITDDQFSNELNIDLFGTFKMAREVARAAMIPAKYGRIINIASMYGLVGNKIAPASPYHAAKGGVVNLTRALACEWGKYGITVNAICPGYFWTPLTKDTLDTDWFKEYAKGAIPMERYGREGELDTTAIFLASPSSSYVNGVMVPVDGGYTSM